MQLFSGLAQAGERRRDLPVGLGRRAALLEIEERLHHRHDLAQEVLSLAPADRSHDVSSHDDLVGQSAVIVVLGLVDGVHAALGEHAGESRDLLAHLLDLDESPPVVSVAAEPADLVLVGLNDGVDLVALSREHELLLYTCGRHDGAFSLGTDVFRT